MTPLFVCHANCCRSVLAEYLYKDLCHAPATSAGLSAGDVINDKCEAMLRHWGIDASAHRPRQITRAMCDEASAIFVMGPSYLHRLVREYGEDLASKCYLFADPFNRPTVHTIDEFKVIDPSFDQRPTAELAADYHWMRSQVRLIQKALESLVPLRTYLDVCKTVDPEGH